MIKLGFHSQSTAMSAAAGIVPAAAGINPAAARINSTADGINPAAGGIDPSATGIDPAAFSRLFPSRFLSFSFPNPQPSPENPYDATLRIAVADSPSPSPNPSSPTIAAVLVPHCRDDDWIFSTPAGHFQLLLSFSSDLPISRLIIIGNLPASSSSPRSYNNASLDCFQESLLPLLFALCPRSAFLNGPPSIPFLVYEDDVIRSAVVEKAIGSAAGEMLVEDVVIDRSPASPELRRRLRFKKMPNLVQTQVRLLPESAAEGIIRPEIGSLVQSYLPHMVSALLFLNSPAINEAFLYGSPPRVLCVGVGGGALPMSLRRHFGFRVLGVEADDVVLSIAKRHFGLVEDESLKIVVGDGIEFIKNCALDSSESDHFHAIMVDLDEADPMSGLSAPPLEFLEKSVVLGARRALHSEGILVVNVIIPSIKHIHARMIEVFRMFFSELYELEVENGENRVIVATASPIGSIAEETKHGLVFEKMKHLNCERFIDSIRKI